MIAAVITSYLLKLGLGKGQELMSKLIIKTDDGSFVTVSMIISV
jgi:hypothetical protein